MANWKRVVGFGVAGQAALYYSPWVNSKVEMFFSEARKGYSWEQVKLKSAELHTLKSASRANRDPWYNGDRSRMNYYMFGEDTLKAPGGDLPRGKDVIEDFIEYEGKARIRPLGPWFDSFSDPRSKDLLDEYTKRSPYKAIERHFEAPNKKYQSSYGGATYPENVPRGASITTFLYDQDGWPEFHDKLVALEKDWYEKLEFEVEDPKVREQIKDTVDAFRLYWGEQLEEWLPYVACRPKQKEKLATFYMNTDPREISALCLQKNGLKQLLLAAGCDIDFDV